MALGALYGLMGGLGQGLSEGNQELGSAIDRYRKFQDAKRERQALGLIQRSALGGLTGGQPADQQQPDYGPGAVSQGPLEPSGPAPGIPSGTAMAPMSIPSRDPEVVKGSWFGTQPGWKDPMSGPQTASGTPLSVPGIALPSRAGLGKQFDVTAPSGQTYRLPQTDVGPAKWTGRGVDINSAAAQQMGYTPQNFPTDKNFKVHPVDQAMGSPPQAAQASSAIAKSTMQGMPQTAFGLVQPAQVAQMIERAAGPGVPDDVKGLALMKLFPMFSEQGQEAYKRAWEQHKFGVQSGEKQEEFRQRTADRVADRDLRGRGLDIQAGHLAEQQQHDRAIEGQAHRGAGGLEGDILRQQDEERQAKGLPKMTAEERMEALAAIKTGTRPAGRQAAAQINAVVSAGNEASGALANLVDMGIGATSGVFMGTQMVPGAHLRDSLFRSIGNTLTTSESQRVDAAFQGVGRSLATIEAAGRATGLVALQGASQALKPEMGDAPITILAKYAEIRQIVDRGVESMSVSPDIGKEQKAKLLEVQAEMRKNVPWTVKDVNALARDPTDEKVAEFARRMSVEGAAAREGGGQMPSWATGSASGAGGKKIFTDGSAWFDADHKPVQ